MKRNFAKLTAVKVSPVHEPTKSGTWLVISDGPTSYKRETVGPVFINPDHVQKVSIDEFAGVGPIVRVDLGDDSVCVAESLELAMLELDGDGEEK